MSGPVLKHELEEIQLTSATLTLSERYSRLIILHPRTLSAFFWAFILICTAVVFLGGYFAIRETDVADWVVPTTTASEIYDSITAAREMIDHNNEITVTGKPPRSELTTYFGVNMIFEWKDKSKKEMFINPRNVQLMCEYEKDLTGLSEYKRFCLTEHADGLNTTCTDLTSDIVPYFYNETGRNDCSLIDDITFQEIFTLGKFAQGLASGHAIFFLDKNADPALGNFETYRTRSSVFLAGPLGADSTVDGKPAKVVDDGSEESIQFKSYRGFLHGQYEKAIYEKYDLDAGSNFFRRPLLVHRYITLGDTITVRYESIFFRDNEFFTTVNSDQLFVAASALFVFICMIIHTRSSFIAITGLVTILVSFPVAIFLFKLVIGIDYFTSVSVIAIFLILGVGADNIFVVTDAWKQSEVLWISLRGISSEAQAKTRNLYGTGEGKTEVEIARMAYTFRRSSMSIFNTSFTTAAAFISNGFSPVVPVSGFGIFSAVAVLVNFLLVLTVVPTLVSLHFTYFSQSKVDQCLCCCSPADTKETLEESKPDTNTVQVVEEEQRTPRKKSVREKLEADEINNGATDIQNKGSGRTSLTLDKYASKEEEELNAEEENILEPSKPTFEERLFENGYVPFMRTSTTIYGRKVHVVAQACILLWTAYGAIMGFYTFQLHTPTTQEEQFQPEHMFYGFVQDFIDLFQGGLASEYMTVELFWGIDHMDRTGFDKFKPEGFRGTPIFNDNFDLSLEESMQHIIDTCAFINNYPCFDEVRNVRPSGCTEDFLAFSNETICPIKDFVQWHAQAYQTEMSVLQLGEANYSLWFERLDEFLTLTDNFENIGIINDEVKFVVMSYVSTMKLYQPSGIKEKFFVILDQLEANIKEDAPPGMETVYETSFDLRWITLELGIVSGMFLGLAISFPLAYLVLVLATMNIILSTLAIISIVAIVLCVLGSVYSFFGWSLGIAESISTVLVIGLAVDYTIHLGHMYQVARAEGIQKREDKFRFSAERMGPTVVAGAITTAGSSAAMFACQLAVFNKMATLITLTILYSLIYALLWFLPLCMLYGPEGHCGDLRSFIPGYFTSQKKPSDSTPKSTKVNSL